MHRHFLRTGQNIRVCLLLTRVFYGACGHTSANHSVDRIQPPCTLVDRMAQPPCTLHFVGGSCLLECWGMRYREFGVSSMRALSDIMTPGMYKGHALPRIWRQYH
jgi:hypothetical protein